MLNSQHTMGRRTEQLLAVALALLVHSTLSTATAVAQAAELKGAARVETRRTEAKRKAGEALDLFRSGDYETALTRFREAHALVPTPPLGVMTARCLDKLGRLLEAADVYRAVIGTDIAASAPPVHREAREDAVTELAKVLADTPKVDILVAGAHDAVVAVDGTVVEIGSPTPLDPGHHTLEARSAGRSVTEMVTLERGEARTITLRVPKPDSLPPPGAGVDEAPTSPWLVTGGSALAIGGAGLLVWAVAGGIGLAQQSDLDAQCPQDRCPPELQDDVDTHGATRTASTVGFVVGAAGIGIAIPLLIVAAVGEDDTGPVQAGPAGMVVRF